MIRKENVPLATLSTLRVGGAARYVFECESQDDVLEALSFAETKELEWRVLGEGSNILASDEGFDGVLIRICLREVSFKEKQNGVEVTVGAGVHWDTLVSDVTSRALWGLENLAGIPGSVGAAPVQNIGAYGSEVKDTIVSVHVLDTNRNEVLDLSADACEFSYRDSLFKRDPSLIILRVTFGLSKEPTPKLQYKDLIAASERGEDLSTPDAIATCVRVIRSQKFPSLLEYGTAGSFFKNPTISNHAYELLSARYEGIPGFPNKQGVKIPVAFVLDKILTLRGYQEGNVSLFERQPLVLVTKDGATQKEIDTFANSIAKRVHDATEIILEREVRSFP